MTIYDRIRIRREELKMSQQELASKLGYKSRSAINKIESGLRDINQSKVLEFSEALQTTPSYLMGWNEDLDVSDRDLNLFAVGSILGGGDPRLIDAIVKLSALKKESLDAVINLIDLLSSVDEK